MIISILGILILQGYWIFSAWNDKEEEFSLAVQQSLIRVAEEIQERELTDYIKAYEKLIDSIGTTDDASFANILLFLDEDKTAISRGWEPSPKNRLIGFNSPTWSVKGILFNSYFSRKLIRFLNTF